MSKIIAAEFITLDGLIAGPDGETDWIFQYYDKEMEEAIISGQSTWDTLLLGRVTYQIMASYWPSVTNDQNPAADFMNDTAKLVFSKTLREATWNHSRVVKDGIEDEVKKLKQRPGKDAAMLGSANLVQYFANHGLVDEYRFLIIPIVLGSGISLFKNMNERHNLKLINTKTFKSGVVGLYYQPDKKEHN